MGASAGPRGGGGVGGGWGGGGGGTDWTTKKNKQASPPAHLSPRYPSLRDEASFQVAEPTLPASQVSDPVTAHRVTMRVFDQTEKSVLH